MARAAGPGTLTRVYHLSKNYIFKYVFWVNKKKITKSILCYSSGHGFSMKFPICKSVNISDKTFSFLQFFWIGFNFVIFCKAYMNYHKEPEYYYLRKILGVSETALDSILLKNIIHYLFF